MEMINRLKMKKDGKGYEDLDGDVKATPTGPAQTGSLSSTGLSASSGTTIVQEDTFTIDQAIDALGFGKFQLKLSIFTGICWMADAMEMMILSILGPALHCDWQLDRWSQAFLTTVVFAGMMVSSSIWGKTCDKYGRRSSLLLCALFTFYYGLLSAFAPNYTWMLILRGLVGFGIGGVPQSVTLYAEFLPSKARAKCVVMIQLFWAIGSTAVVFLAIFVMPTLGWRYLLAFASLPCLHFALACLWLPESVRFLVAMGDMDAAMETLERVAKDNGKPMLLGRLVEPVYDEGVKVKRGRIIDLLVPELRMTTLLLWFIWLANAFSYYGVVLMTTELFEADDKCHGGSGKAGLEVPPCNLLCKNLDTKDYVDLLWTTFAEFPGFIITFLVIEYLGRKKTMAGEFFVFSVAIALVAICTRRTILTIFLFVARAFISGAFQTAYVYTPEVYPTTTRAIGLGSCSGMARVGALVTPFVAQVMLQKSVPMTVGIYSALCLVAAGASLLLPIETKGREMQDSHIAVSKLSQATIEFDPAVASQNADQSD